MDNVIRLALHFPSKHTVFSRCQSQNFSLCNAFFLPRDTQIWCKTTKTNYISHLLNYPSLDTVICETYVTLTHTSTALLQSQSSVNSIQKRNSNAGLSCYILEIQYMRDVYTAQAMSSEYICFHYAQLKKETHFFQPQQPGTQSDLFC